MVGSSKILTVSYGTFSCTLEGFDDSFDTMRAIAEYFRDLAADDRYFGAEPPTPDAEMLARIAEREIARRVEAYEQQGRIVLRAQDAAVFAGVPATQAQAAADDTPEGQPVARDAANTRDAQPPARSEATEPEAEQPEVTDTPPETGDVMEAAPSAPVQRPDMPEAPVVETGEGEAGEVETGEEETGEAVETVAEHTVPEPEQETWHIIEEEAAHAENQGLAAKLNLIRSVVGGGGQYDEDEHAQDFLEPHAGDDAHWAETDETEETDAAGDAAENPVAAAPPQDTPAPDEVLGPDVPVSAQPDTNETRGDSEFQDTLSALLADASPEPHPAAIAEEAQPAMDLTEAEEASSDPVEAEAEEATPVPTRVFKVKRADFEAEQADGLLEEDAQNSSPSDIAQADAELAGEHAGEQTGENIFGEDDSDLSPEEEADLQRELAELEADMDIEDEAASLPVASSGSAPAVPGNDTRTSAGDEDNLSRIFDEADNQMASTETSKRRNTIQHLRAALAASRAEKEAGAELNAKVDENPYRDDLAAVVRPRRAESTGTRSPRPVESRPAPLKLVAEQRVDTNRAPVRPRRVSTPAPEVLASRENGFSEFVAKMGATALPDLLEAAAAYLADVEGREQFSRPMLMGKLREVDEDGFSREEGLRSFGQLLREGKLQKLSGGRFAVTDETEFRAHAKRHAS